MKDKIRQELDDLHNKLDGHYYDYVFDEYTAKLLELMRGIVPKKKECQCEYHDEDCDCVEFEGYNTCREEMLKKLESK